MKDEALQGGTIACTTQLFIALFQPLPYFQWPSQSPL